MLPDRHHKVFVPPWFLGVRLAARMRPHGNQQCVHHIAKNILLENTNSIAPRNPVDRCISGAVCWKWKPE